MVSDENVSFCMSRILQVPFLSQQYSSIPCDTLRPGRANALFLSRLVAERTNLRLDEMREGIKATGTGVGGSGGIQEGRVKEVTVREKGHLFPFEAVGATAQECGKWLGEEMKRYRNIESKWLEEREKMTPQDHMTTSKKWLDVVKPFSSFKNKL